MEVPELNKQFCRICLKRDGLLVSIYKRVEQQQTDLCTLLLRCANIKVTNSDTYSKYLCEECTEELLVAAKFRDKCDATKKAIYEQCFQRIENGESPKNIFEVQKLNADDNAGACNETASTPREDRTRERIDSQTEGKDSKAKRTKAELNCDEPKDSNSLNGGQKRHQCISCCVYCGQCLKTASSLIEHFRTHTKEPPFDCSYCSKTFNNSGSLNNHEKRHIRDGDVLKE